MRETLRGFVFYRRIRRESNGSCRSQNVGWLAGGRRSWERALHFTSKSLKMVTFQAFLEGLEGLNMIRSYSREKEWCATHSPSQTVYTDSHLSDWWMPTLHPLVTAPTAPFAPWRPALLFSHILHCAWNTEAPGPLVILTLSIYNPASQACGLQLEL